MSSLNIIRSIQVSLSLSVLTLPALAAPLDSGTGAVVPPDRPGSPVRTPGRDAGLVQDSRPSSPFYEPKVGAFASPLGLVVGIVAADVGVAVTPHVALTLGGSGFDYGVVSGYGVDLGTQLFLGKDAFRGIYMQPRVGFDQAQVSMPDLLTGRVVEDSVTLMHFDALAGYQWLFDSGLSIRLGAGVRYSAGLGDVQGMDVSQYQRVRGMLDGAVGYVF